MVARVDKSLLLCAATVSCRPASLEESEKGSLAVKVDLGPSNSAFDVPVCPSPPPED